MRNWIYILLSVIILCAWTEAPMHDPMGTPKAFKELPVMRVNVYMMGREEVDESVSVKIFENIEYLNEAFQGQIAFVFNELFMDPNHAYLPDIYESYRIDRDEIIEPIVDPIEKKGAINIYLFDTYSEGGHSDALMGFTPLLSANQDAYATNSPRFDRILMAYEGLEGNQTMVHEMGHFFGLKHPWELSTFAKHRIGIRSKEDESKNHMSYGLSVEEFTPEQLEEMRKYALNYRRYLMDRVVRVYAGL